MTKELNDRKTHQEVLPIETERLLLIPLDHGLVQALIEKNEELLALSGFKVNHFWPSEELYTILTEFVETLAAGDKPSGFNGWVIVDKKSLIAIGDIGFNGEPNYDRMVEMGYTVINKEQGQGYCTEASLALLNWARSTNLILRVEAECLVDNKASIRVLEKSGFSVQTIVESLMHWHFEMNTIFIK